MLKALLTFLFPPRRRQLNGQDIISDEAINAPIALANLVGRLKQFQTQQPMFLEQLQTSFTEELQTVLKKAIERIDASPDWSQVTLKQQSAHATSYQVYYLNSLIGFIDWHNECIGLGAVELIIQFRPL